MRHDDTPDLVRAQATVLRYQGCTSTAVHGERPGAPERSRQAAPLD